VTTRCGSFRAENRYAINGVRHLLYAAAAGIVRRPPRLSRYSE
jgi:hypothetical protein